MLSDMLLPGMNADWAPSIKDGRIDFNLAARMPLIHLYRKSQQAMGWKSLSFGGFRILGTRVKEV